jgi:hypothetical protein
MTTAAPHPKNALWPWLWEYVCLFDDEEGLKPKPEDQDEDGEPDEQLDGPEPSDDDGDDGDYDDTGDENQYEFDEDGDEEVADEDSDEDGYAPDYEISEPVNAPPSIPGYAVIKSPNGSVDHLREFDSWWSFAACASDLRLRQWHEYNCASHESGDRYGGRSWHGTSTFDEAVDMALRRGWPEGRELLRESIVAVRPKPKVYESLEFEVAGAFPCVPLYCAGDPQWMVSDPGANFRMAKPIVRIDYNNWVHAGVDVKSMMLRGAAIVSLADTLERQGFSVELRIIGNSKQIYGGRKVFRYSIVYKRAGEPLDLDRAAFAIAHPASMRRLAFAILEQHRELETSFEGNYGSPMYERNPVTHGEEGMTVLFVPGPDRRETPGSAQEAVEKAATKLLNSIELEAAD